MDIGETAVESGPCLDTVRALHQTVVALRTALEQSRNEIVELKQRSWPKKSLENALKNLAIENHILKNAILKNEAKDDVVKHVKIITPPRSHEAQSTPRNDEPTLFNNSVSPIPQEENTNLIDISISIEKISSKRVSNSLENLTLINNPRLPRSLSLSKTFSYSNSSMNENRLSARTMSTPLNVSSSPNISLMERSQNSTPNALGLENAQSEPVLPQNDLEQNEEVDDIELIFTTDETRDSDFKEELVPIDAETPNRNLQLQSEFDQSLSDRELDDDVFSEVDNKKENSQLCNSKSDNSINHEEKSLKSYYSLQDSSFENKSLEKDESFDRFDDRVRIIETDISKCGIIDVDYLSGRRNTCPNPLPYRPIIHREAIGKGLNMKKGRPILTCSNNARRESGVQTDISAVPSSSWRSESSLAHKAKVGDHFTTLPSKFPLPGSRLRLSEKTNVEARRILLSDIGFTSMVPELSRSADHLCPVNLKAPVPTTYGQFLRTPDLYSPSVMSQKFTWTATTASPSEISQLHSQFGSTYPLSSPPAPSRRFSAPVSPSRRMTIKPTTSKVRFANGSLPELRTDWSTIDSGDSTDSLVEEAEHYLRRSIDCISENYNARRDEFRSRKFRRASAPEPTGDNVPPQNWQPFLPRNPRDLHLDHWVKVIVPEGRVRGGRVRYVGALINQTEQYVGVQLSTPEGHSDGTYKNRRYFNCEPCHGIFVPFKKVVMGWRP